MVPVAIDFYVLTHNQMLWLKHFCVIVLVNASLEEFA